MATKTIKKRVPNATSGNSKKTADILKNKARNLNEAALKTSNQIVDETLATGEEWQNIMAKTMKKGTALFGKQQDLVLTTLEGLKDQYSYGNKRFWQLLSFKPINTKTPAKTTKKAAKAVAKTTANIDEVMEAATKTAKKTVKKTVKKAEASKNLATASVKKTAPKKAVKKATTKKVANDKLILIEGIGPKIQGLLNQAGITTFDQLAKTKPAALKKVLTDAGSRFQMHDPSTWAAQAKLAAAGKMDELKTLQVELKGGK